MYRLFALGLILAAASPLQAAAAPPTTHREILNVRYSPGAGSRHTLDLFIPKDIKGKPPVVLFVHGGTWMVGDKNFFGLYRGVGRLLARNGVVAVLPNYRLSPLVKHPEHIKDVARAFAWCHNNIARHGGDPARILLAGHSAGAHLVSLLITDKSYLKNPDLRLDNKANKSIKGIIAISGVYRIPGPDEFQAMARRTVEVMVGEPGSGKLAMLGPPLMKISPVVNPFNLVFGKGSDVKSNASPLNHVRKGLPPFLLLNAEREVPGLWNMAEEFCLALKKNGVSVEHHEIEGVTHRTIIKHLHNDEARAAKLILAFVTRLGGAAR